jgi:hypothetical protein
MAALAKWRDDNNGSIATAGTSTAYTITSNTVFTSLALMDNATLTFIPHATSGATPTLNVDGLGAKVIRNATGVALPTGALLAGSVYRATYDNGNGEWLLHNQTGVIPTSAVVTASIADDAVTYAKMQNVSATARVLGRATSGAGNVEEIPLAGGLSISGGALTSSQTATNVASQSDQETATSTTTFVSPGRQQYHPSAAKAWALVAANGSTLASYGVSATSNTGTGTYRITFSTAFSSTNYVAVGMGDTNVIVYATSKAVGTMDYSVVQISGGGGTGTGTNQIHQVLFFGDQ